MWKFDTILTDKGSHLSIYGLLILGVLQAQHLQADPTQVASRTTISLPDAVNKTLSNNPDLLAFDLELKAQQGRVLQAGLAPSPALKFELEDALGSGVYNGLSSAQTTISIDWVVERGFRQHLVAAADVGSSLVTIEANIMRLDLAAETARRYLTCLAFQARVLTADSNIALATATIDAVEKRVKAGKAPLAERYRAQAELARKQLQREDIEHERATANRRLAAQWGATSPSFAHVSGDIYKPPNIVSFQSLHAQLQRNPELAKLMSQQRLQATQLLLAKAQNKPNWRLNTGVRYSGDNDDVALVSGITIPFGKRTRNPGKIATASANLEKIALAKNAANIRIETTLYVVYEQLRHSLHVLDALRTAVIPPLEQALTDTRRAYELGRYSYLEWRSVQAELLDAQETLLETSIDAHRYVIEIERLTGAQVTQSRFNP